MEADLVTIKAALVTIKINANNKTDPVTIEADLVTMEADLVTIKAALVTIRIQTNQK
jgi:hypothetical protein